MLNLKSLLNKRKRQDQLNHDRKKALAHPLKDVSSSSSPSTPSKGEVMEEAQVRRSSRCYNNGNNNKPLTTSNDNGICHKNKSLRRKNISSSMLLSSTAASSDQKKDNDSKNGSIPHTMTTRNGVNDKVKKVNSKVKSGKVEPTTQEKTKGDVNNRTEINYANNHGFVRKKQIVDTATRYEKHEKIKNSSRSRRNKMNTDNGTNVSSLKTKATKPKNKKKSIKNVDDKKECNENNHQEEDQLNHNNPNDDVDEYSLQEKLQAQTRMEKSKNRKKSKKNKEDIKKDQDDNKYRKEGGRKKNDAHANSSLLQTKKLMEKPKNSMKKSKNIGLDKNENDNKGNGDDNNNHPSSNKIVKKEKKDFLPHAKRKENPNYKKKSKKFEDDQSDDDDDDHNEQSFGEQNDNVDDNNNDHQSPNQIAKKKKSDYENVSELKEGKIKQVKSEITKFKKKKIGVYDSPSSTKNDDRLFTIDDHDSSKEFTNKCKTTVKENDNNPPTNENSPSLSNNNASITCDDGLSNKILVNNHKAIIKEKEEQNKETPIKTNDKLNSNTEEKIKSLIPSMRKLISNTNTISNDKNNQNIMNFLSSIMIHSNDISDEFLETSGLPSLLKDMKCAFKNKRDSTCLILCKEVFKIMKNKYNEERKNAITTASTYATSTTVTTDISSVNNDLKQYTNKIKCDKTPSPKKNTSSPAITSSSSASNQKHSCFNGTTADKNNKHVTNSTSLNKRNKHVGNNDLKQECNNTKSIKSQSPKTNVSSRLSIASTSYEQRKQSIIHEKKQNTTISNRSHLRGEKIKKRMNPFRVELGNIVMIRHQCTNIQEVFITKSANSNGVIIGYKKECGAIIDDTKGKQKFNNIKGLTTKISHNTNNTDDKIKWMKPDPMKHDRYMLIGKMIRFPISFLIISSPLSFSSTTTNNNISSNGITTENDTSIEDIKTALIVGEVISLLQPSSNNTTGYLMVEVLIDKKIIKEYNLQNYAVQDKKKKNKFSILEEKIKGLNKIKVHVKLPSPWNNKFSIGAYWEILKLISANYNNETIENYDNNTFIGKVINMILDPKEATYLTSNNNNISASAQKHETKTLATVLLKRLWLPEQTKNGRLVSHHKYNEVFDYNYDEDNTIDADTFIQNRYWKVNIEDLIVISKRLIRPIKTNAIIDDKILWSKYNLYPEEIMYENYTYDTVQNKFMPFNNNINSKQQKPKSTHEVGKKYPRFCYRCRRIGIYPLQKCNEVSCCDNDKVKRVKWWCESCCEYFRVPDHSPQNNNNGDNENNWIGPCCLGNYQQQGLEDELRINFMDSTSRYLSKERQQQSTSSDDDDGDDICKHLLDIIESSNNIDFTLPLNHITSTTNKGRKRQRDDISKITIDQDKMNTDLEDSMSCARCIDMHSLKRKLSTSSSSTQDDNKAELKNNSLPSTNVSSSLQGHVNLRLHCQSFCRIIGKNNNEKSTTLQQQENRIRSLKDEMVEHEMINSPKADNINIEQPKNNNNDPNNNTTKKQILRHTHVYQDEKSGSWQTYFRYDKFRLLGCFATKDEANNALETLRNKLQEQNHATDKESVDEIVTYIRSMRKNITTKKRNVAKDNNMSQLTKQKLKSESSIDSENLHSTQSVVQDIEYAIPLSTQDDYKTEINFKATDNVSSFKWHQDKTEPSKESNDLQSTQSMVQDIEYLIPLSTQDDEKTKINNESTNNVSSLKGHQDKNYKEDHTFQQLHKSAPPPSPQPTLKNKTEINNKSTYNISSLKGHQDKNSKEDHTLQQLQKSAPLLSPQPTLNNEISYNKSDVIKQIKSGTLQQEQYLRYDKSPIHQWGVFTTKPIRKNGMIIEYKGEIISNTMADKRETEYNKNNSFKFCDYMFRIDASIVCDAMKCGNMARFINASCDPNCYTEIVENPITCTKHIIIFAKRDIDIDEELCYDYKFPIEYDQSKWIKCRCQAKNCRGYMNV